MSMTVEDLKDAVCDLVSIAEEHLERKYFEELDNKGVEIINILEEVEQYRALEEKLNGISVKEVVEHFIKTVEKQTEEDYTNGRILTNKEAEEWEQLKEKATAKKVAYQGEHEKCPSCGSFHVYWKYCSKCGQAVEFD